MAKIVHPHPDLEGEVLPVDLVSKLSLFAKNKAAKSLLEKYPDYLVLRRFAAKEIICRQGEPGWTAFFVLPPEDTVAVLERKLADLTKDRMPAGAPLRKGLEAELNVYRLRGEERKTKPGDNEACHMATVYLAVERKSGSSRGAVLRLLNARGQSLNQPLRNYEDKTFFLPADASIQTANFDSLRAPVLESELFGEHSCLYRAPRGATIVTRRECYMIEMLRNIFELIVNKDPVYAKRRESQERERYISFGMRKFSLFADLDDTTYEKVKDSVELLNVDPGEIICDEHDRADGVFIVRSGLVKVVKNVSALLRDDGRQSDVTKWPELIAALKAGEQTPQTPAGQIWARLPAPARESVQRTPAGAAPARADTVEIVFGLNEVIKSPKLADLKEFEPVLKNEVFLGRARELLDERKQLRATTRKADAELPPLAMRRLNRLLLGAMFPQALTPGRPEGPECIINYYSYGDYVGLIGPLSSQPHNVTCLAYGHPDQQGEAQLIKLPAATFRQLCNDIAPLGQNVRQEANKRRQQAMQRLLMPLWNDNNQVQLSDRFEQLGLIQGQRLMMIDLEKCTRCDECVRACVATHKDGRSRLFLDGPRFGKFQVPITCRSCLDPVCLSVCPVSSIHRGKNREIVIEDWCIGCGQCADHCPYGSIQMHDLGVIPVSGRGWRFGPEEPGHAQTWFQPKFLDARWPSGSAPFLHERMFLEEGVPVWGRELRPDEAVLFRYPFSVGERDLFSETRGAGSRKAIERMRLIVTSFAAEVSIWLDGQPLPERKPKQGRREYLFPTRPVAKPADAGEKDEVVPIPLGMGKHVLAVRVKPPMAADKEPLLLKAGLYPERKPDLPDKAAEESVKEEITEKLVDQRAVVCDLCSTLPGRSPACVRACPHDAAIRVTARTQFPQG